MFKVCQYLAIADAMLFLKGQQKASKVCQFTSRYLLSRRTRKLISRDMPLSVFAPNQNIKSITLGISSQSYLSYHILEVVLINSFKEWALLCSIFCCIHIGEWTWYCNLGATPWKIAGFFGNFLKWRATLSTPFGNFNLISTETFWPYCVLGDLRVFYGYQHFSVFFPSNNWKNWKMSKIVEKGPTPLGKKPKMLVYKRYHPIWFKTSILKVNYLSNYSWG